MHKDTDISDPWYKKQKPCDIKYDNHLVMNTFRQGNFHAIHTAQLRAIIGAITASV